MWNDWHEYYDAAVVIQAWKTQSTWLGELLDMDRLYEYWCPSGVQQEFQIASFFAVVMRSVGLSA
jgi:hypothetical protein